MRVKQFISGYTKSQENQDIMNLNGKISFELWVDLFEQHYLKSGLLIESVNGSLVEFIDNIKQRSEMNPKIGNDYLIIPIAIQGNQYREFDSDLQYPLKSKPRYYKLMGINDGIYEFNDGKITLNWPDRRLTKLSYMTLILCNDEDQYLGITTFLSLRFK